MTQLTPLEARVAALISAYADRAPAAVDAAAMTRFASATSISRQAGRSRFRWSGEPVLVLVVLGLLVALATSALTVGRELLTDESAKVRGEAVLVEPFVGLPPMEAPPSTPEQGELVLGFYGRVQSIGNDVYGLWVFEDGRVIWRRNLEHLSKDTTRPFGDTTPTHGVLEQRLTPEGVELLRREVIPLTAPIAAREAVMRGGPGVMWGSLQLRVDDRLADVSWTDARLPQQLAYLANWMPPDAWADRRIAGYVPTRYAVCVNRWDPVQRAEVDPLKTFDSLPDATMNLIRLHAGPVFSPAGWRPSIPCRVLALDDARAVHGTLVEAGLAGASQYGGLWYTLPNRADPRLELGMFMVPLLPSGDIVGSGS